MFFPDAEPSRKERGHQRCEAAPPKPERRKASWGGFLERPGTASIFLAASVALGLRAPVRYATVRAPAP